MCHYVNLLPNKDIFLAKVLRTSKHQSENIGLCTVYTVIKSYDVDTVIVERKVQIEYSLMDIYIRSRRMSVEICLMDKRKNNRTLGMNSGMPNGFAHNRAIVCSQLSYFAWFKHERQLYRSAL